MQLALKPSFPCTPVPAMNKLVLVVATGYKVVVFNMAIFHVLSFARMEGPDALPWLLPRLPRFLPGFCITVHPAGPSASIPICGPPH